jgi:hypothetical protein
MNCAIKQLIGANGYSPAVAAVSNIANGAGGSAGAAVTVALTFEDQYGNGTLPANYSVAAAPSQACMVSVTSKTTSGFSVVLTPPSGVTLAAGTFDVVVHA